MVRPQLTHLRHAWGDGACVRIGGWRARAHTCRLNFQHSFCVYHTQVMLWLFFSSQLCKSILEVSTSISHVTLENNIGMRLRLVGKLEKSDNLELKEVKAEYAAEPSGTGRILESECYGIVAK